MEIHPTDIPLKVIEALRSAQLVAILTGAGISAESGIPTFREAQSGLWAQYTPEELATPEAFQRNPDLVWSWYTWRRELVSKAEPNAGHLALAKMEQLVPSLSLITQNVDGLHQRAGSGSRFPIIELHGNILRTKCFSEGRLIDSWEESGNVPPRCPHCGGKLRPDVVWFGEALPHEALQASWKAAENCEVFFSVGTSGIVEPAASLPFVALRRGAMVIEINPNPTPLTASVEFVLQGPSGKVLPELVQAAWHV